jgi:uncharacterized protein (DUF934 family)
MPQLIRSGAVTHDRWTLLREPVAALPASPVIVPLATWLASRAELRARADVGIWLAPTDDPALLAADVTVLPVIAVDFPRFADGRGYSIARLLRDRFGYAGELRAVGDIARDQLYFLHQAGFDAFVLRDSKDAQDALASLRDFTDGYQATARRTPWFRRSGVTAPATGVES